MAKKSNPHEDGRNAHDAGLNAAQCPYEYTNPARSKKWRSGWWERFWEVHGTDLGPPESWGTRKEKDAPAGAGGEGMIEVQPGMSGAQSKQVYARHGLTWNSSHAEVTLTLGGLEAELAAKDTTIAALRRDCQELEQGRAMAEAVTMDAEAKLEQLRQSAHTATNECATLLIAERVENARLRALIAEAATAVEWANVLMPPVELREWDTTCRNHGVDVALLTRLQESNATE